MPFLRSAVNPQNQIIKRLLFCAAALGQAGCYSALVLLGNLRHHVPDTLCIFAAAFLLYLLTLRLLKPRSEPEPPVTSSEKNFSFKNRYLLAVLGLAVLYRCMLLPLAPTLSDDMYRYIWEGRVVARGHNPFALAPNAPELEDLQDAVIYPLVSRPHLSAIYPPMAQFIFALASGIDYSVTSMKTAFTLFDLATIGLLLLTLAALGMNPLRVAVYALNPLVIVEFSGSGHLDSAGIFFMMLALYLCLKRKSLWPVAALSLGFLIKIVPLLLLPAILKKRKLAGLALFAGIASAAFLPFIDAGRQLFSSLTIFTEYLMFNGALYSMLVQTVQSHQIARRIVAALVCLCTAGLYYRYFKKDQCAYDDTIFHQALLLIGILLLFAPVLYPWYVCWIVPLLVIAPNRAWLLLSGLVFASYWVLKQQEATGIWKETNAVLFFEYVPFYALLICDWAKNFFHKLKFARNHAETLDCGQQ